MKPIKKCAVLLGIIKEENANNVLSYLSGKEKDKIFKEIEKTQDFSKKEKKTVLLYFLDFFKKTQKPVVSLELISLLIIFSVIAVLFFLIIYLDNINRHTLAKIYQSFSNSGGIYFFIYPFLSYFTRKTYGKSPFRLLFQEKGIIINAFIGICGALILFFILIIVNRIVDSYAPKRDILFYALILSQGILAPITEEIFFRRFLYVKLSVDINKPVSFFVISMAFALVHIPTNIAVLMLYFLSGILLTGIYEWRKSLLPCFISHSFANIAFYLSGNFY